MLINYPRQEKLRGWHPKEIEKEGFKLLQKFAALNSNIAIRYLIGAYKYGYYGLNVEDPNNQTKGLQLAKFYADKGNASAIYLLCLAYSDKHEGNFGLNVQDPTVQQEGLRLTQYYAQQDSEHAIGILLESYLYGYFGLDKDNPSIQKKGLQLTKSYVEQGVEQAIDVLDEVYRSGGFGLEKESPEIKTFLEDKCGYTVDGDE